MNGWEISDQRYGREDEVTRGTYVRRERNLHSVYRQVGLPAEVKAD
jgi:HSP20 family molecular chaperone IbpA